MTKVDDADSPTWWQRMFKPTPETAAEAEAAASGAPGAAEQIVALQEENARLRAALAEFAAASEAAERQADIERTRHAATRAERDRAQQTHQVLAEQLEESETAARHLRAQLETMGESQRRLAEEAERARTETVAATRRVAIAQRRTEEAERVAQQTARRAQSLQQRVDPLTAALESTRRENAALEQRIERLRSFCFTCVAAMHRALSACVGERIELPLQVGWDTTPGTPWRATSTDPTQTVLAVADHLRELGLASIAVERDAGGRARLEVSRVEADRGHDAASRDAMARFVAGYAQVCLRASGVVAAPERALQLGSDRPSTAQHRRGA